MNLRHAQNLDSSELPKSGFGKREDRLLLKPIANQHVIEKLPPHGAVDS